MRGLLVPVAVGQQYPDAKMTGDRNHRVDTCTDRYKYKIHIQIGIGGSRVKS